MTKEIRDHVYAIDKSSHARKINGSVKKINLKISQHKLKSCKKRQNICSLPLAVS